MTLLKKTMMAAGMASIALSPIAATAAAPIAPSVARAAPASVDDSDLRGRGGGLIIALLVLAGLTAAYFLIEDNDDNGRPVSP